MPNERSSLGVIIILMVINCEHIKYLEPAIVTKVVNKKQY